MFLEENKLLKLQRFSFENLCENKEQFRSATGINPDCFMRLFNYLTQETTQDTSKLLSEEKYTKSKEVKSGPKPKISGNKQLFMYLSWLKNGFTLSHVLFLFQVPKATVSRYLHKLLGLIFCIFLLARYLFGLHVSKGKKKCEKYLKEHTPLLDAY